MFLKIKNMQKYFFIRTKGKYLKLELSEIQVEGARII
jgi:hypothetical protein